jgi:FkbM family methyltransferase
MNSDMALETRIRSLARKWLPPGVRQPLGSIAGKFNHLVLDGLKGLIFDLSGGKFRVDGCVFSIPKDLTSRPYRACFFDKSYEAEERELIRGAIRPTDRVLECGACLGIVSCVTNGILQDKTGHVVVEGNPYCIPWLHRNREMNNCGFLVENCAASTSADVTFYLHPVYIVGGTAQRKTARAVRVPGRSLKDLENHYGPFTALVMDIEGAELEMLQASRDLLAHYRVVIIELHEFAIGKEGVEQCRRVLSDVGFTFVKAAGLTEVWERKA